MIRKRRIEGRKPFRARMEASGLWQEALAYREVVRRRLALENPSLTQAKIASLAHQAVLAKYPKRVEGDSGIEEPKSNFPCLIKQDGPGVMVVAPIEVVDADGSLTEEAKIAIKASKRLGVDETTGRCRGGLGGSGDGGSGESVGGDSGMAVGRDSGKSISRDSGKFSGFRKEVSHSANDVIRLQQSELGRRSAESLSPLVPADRRSGVSEVTRWVFENVGMPWDSIEVDSIPSRGAVFLLKLAKLDGPWFCTTYHSKLLPSRQQVERKSADSFQDSSIEELTSELMRLSHEEPDAVQPLGSKVVREELGISPQAV